MLSTSWAKLGWHAGDRADGLTRRADEIEPIAREPARSCAGDDLERQDAEREDIGPVIYVGIRAQLLGRHVVGRAELDAGRRAKRALVDHPGGRSSFASPKSSSFTSSRPA